MLYIWQYSKYAYELLEENWLNEIIWLISEGAKTSDPL